VRLLLIEDETRIAEILKAALTQSGFAVDAVTTCTDARTAIAINPYDAAILDLGLPDGDGIKLLGEFRSTGNQMPILVLTARDAIEDRVGGLNSGADDYLVKPFAMAELIARTKALLRRPGSALGATLEAGNVKFDTVGCFRLGQQISHAAHRVDLRGSAGLSKFASQVMNMNRNGIGPQLIIDAVELFLKRGFWYDPTQTSHEMF
jgi:DNA-binding response OmpR family regulator